MRSTGERNNEIQIDPSIGRSTRSMKNLRVMISRAREISGWITFREKVESTDREISTCYANLDVTRHAGNYRWNSPSNSPSLDHTRSGV